MSEKKSEKIIADNRKARHDYFIEETYEVIEAIDTSDPVLLREELGDVLLQVAFHTEIEKEKRKQRLMRESKKALKQRIAALEADIAATEELIEELETKMGDPATYQNEKTAAQVARDHQTAQEKLEALYEEWGEVYELME